MRFNSIMKKSFVLILLLFISLGLKAQLEDRARNLPAFDYKVLRFGFTVGFNTMDVGFTRNYDAEDFVYADLSSVLPGFQVSIVSVLRLNENWNLRFLPGISFGSRDITFYNYSETDGVGDLVDLPNVGNPVNLGPSFLDFPLLLKYRSERVHNSRPYLVGGLNFRYDMSAKSPGKYDSESDAYMKFKRGDLYLEFGFGLDTYLRYFKFAPEIKVGIGLLNIMDPKGRTGHPEFANSIESAHSFIVMLNFHFE